MMSEKQPQHQVDEQYGSGHKEPTIPIERPDDSINLERQSEDSPVEGVLAGVALESLDMRSAKVAIELRPGDILRATEEIEKITRGTTSGNSSDMSKLLLSLGDTPSTIREGIDPNIGDEEVRLVLLRTLEREIDILGDNGLLPERVQANRTNNLKQVASGYNYENNKYSSREYAAMLALAMLDGSFDYGRSQSSRHDDLPGDHVANGQHRQAAEMVLKKQYRTEQVASSVKEVDSETLKDFLYQLRGSTELMSGDLAKGMSGLDNIRDLLRNELVDGDLIGQEAQRLDSTINDVISQISKLQSQLYSIEHQDLSGSDSETVESIQAELKVIFGQINNIRDDGSSPYPRLIHTIYTNDLMNINQLKCQVANGSFDSFSDSVSYLRIKINSLGQ